MTNQTDRIEADINRSRHALNDTIEALGSKLSPGQMVDEVLGLAQGQAGQFAANLGKQAKENPLPVVLVGAGLALMFMNRKNSGTDGMSRNTMQPHERSFSQGAWADEGRYRNLEKIRSGYAQAADETHDAFSQRLHEAEAAALEMKQNAGEAIDAFKARVKSAGEAMAHTAHGVRDRMSAGIDKASHFMADEGMRLKASAGDVKHKAQDIYAEYPLVAGVIGLAIGALAGAVAPLSSVEREGLHDVADAANRAGADLAEKGARAAEKAAEKAQAALH